jgi:hypothetical protein
VLHGLLFSDADDEEEEDDVSLIVITSWVLLACKTTKYHLLGSVTLIFVF